MTDLTDSLTILVPTRNRPYFLRRLLHYMSQMRIRSAIAVIDSSDPQQMAENADVIRRHDATLCVKQVCDTRGMIPKCRHAVESVETPYAVFCADDDFLLPDSAMASVEFLEQNSDYGCAMGSWAYLHHDAGDRCHQTRCFPLDDHDPLKRCGKLAKNWFSNFYAVYRTEPLRKAWVLTDQSTDFERARVFPETLLAQLCTLYCKMAILPHLHLLLSLHDDNEHRKTPLIADHSSRDEMYNRFRDTFVAEIRRCCDVDRQVADSFVEHHYGFLSRELPEGQGRVKGLARLKKNVKTQVYTNRDRIFRSPTNIWIRRRLRQNNALCQTTAWQAAYDLATRFPLGIHSSDQMNHSQAA